MKKAFCLMAASLLLAGCSIRQFAFNTVADSMAPYPSAKAEKKPKDDGKTDPMVALTGENDPELVAAFLPAALKMYEMMLFSNPEHEGLGLMTGQLYVTYANAFVQTPAERIPSEEFDSQNAEYLRAQNFYVRGKNYVLAALDHRFRNFSKDVFGDDDGARNAMLAKCKKNDAASLYWAASGSLGAFALSPLETKYLEALPGSLAMLERAAALDPGFNRGAIWEVLMAFYASAPETLGGGRDKAVIAYEKALEHSLGQSPTLYIGYAKSFCIPAQDGEGFDLALEKALAIDPESRPEERLALTLARRQAEWLKDHKADFIL